MRRSWITLLVLLVVSKITLEAQITNNPTVLPSGMASPIPGSEVNYDNLLLMGVTLSSDFDDNALNNDRNKQANFDTVVAPHMGWNVSGPEARWVLDYSPRFSESEPLSAYNARSQLLETNLDFSLSKRARGSLRERFFETKNPFDRLQSEFAPGSNLLDHPNDSLITSARTTSEQAGADLKYALDRHTTVGASGTFYKITYNSFASSKQVGSSSSTNGQLTYSKHVSQNQWIGLEYNVQHLISQDVQSRSFVNGVLCMETILLSANTMLSFFAGPEHSLTNYEIAGFGPSTTDRSRAKWGWSGGGSYSWFVRHSDFSAGFVRRISNGEPHQGIVQVSSAMAAAKRQLARQWKAELLFSYTNNRALIANVLPLSYLSLAIGFTRALNPKLSFDVRYWRLHEFAPGLVQGVSSAEHNRLSLSVMYDIKTRPGI